jgi:Ca2+-binding RTX toxin-like protein
MAIRLGNNAANILTGTNGADQIFGFGGDDTLRGLGGADFISAGAGNDIVFAGSGDDVVLGGAGNDDLHGEQGDDVIIGGSGNDHIVGGRGADLLSGGTGRDTFDYNFLRESVGGNTDTILDFSRAQGDKIDLKDLHLDVTGRNQDRITFEHDGDDTIIHVNTDRDRADEFTLHVHDNLLVARADLILV